jgi:flagellar hook-basal body complex protein FliE
VTVLPVSALGAEGTIRGLSPAETSIAPVTDPTGGGGSSGGFAGMLGQALDSLDQTQSTAASAATSLATGTATDSASAVLAVQHAQLAMDLASTLRDKITADVQQLYQIQA